MNAFRQLVPAVAVALFLSAQVVHGEGESSAPRLSLPNVTDILQKVVARAKWVESQGARSQYSFDTLKVTEDLDDDGSVKKKKEQIFHIKPIGGLPYARMTRNGGKPLSEKELKTEDELEKKFRARLAGGKTAAEEKHRSLRISDELLRHFDYSVIGRDALNGRETYVVRFTPKSTPASEKDMVDRFLNRMAGRVWVDAADFEAARIEVELQESIDIWIGLVGSLKKLAFTIEQQRMPDGIWVPAGSHGEIQARKFLSSSHTRYREQTQDYKRAE